jgi:beta-glucosidase
VRDRESKVIRQYKELKGFEKVNLNPGEKKEINFTLDKRSFAYYSDEVHDWIVETGNFDTLVGPSSSEIPPKDSVFVNSTDRVKVNYCRNTRLDGLRWG